MFTYYLCDDNNTIYRIEFSIKQEEKNYYLSLLDNYLNELIFIEENESKKLVEKELIEDENKDNIYNENGYLSLVKDEVINVEKIEDYLPSIITIKTKKYYFLRSYTISMLIYLLSDDITHSSNPILKKIVSSPRQKGYYFIDFSTIYSFFFNENGNLLNGKDFDYNALRDLFQNLNVVKDTRYSANELRCFWAGDDAERAIADSIVGDAFKNKEYLNKLGNDFFTLNNQQLIKKR